MDAVPREWIVFLLARNGRCRLPAAVALIPPVLIPDVPIEFALARHTLPCTRRRRRGQLCGRDKRVFSFFQRAAAAPAQQCGEGQYRVEGGMLAEDCRELHTGPFRVLSKENS